VNCSDSEEILQKNPFYFFLNTPAEVDRDAGHKALPIRHWPIWRFWISHPIFREILRDLFADDSYVSSHAHCNTLFIRHWIIWRFWIASHITREILRGATHCNISYNTLQHILQHTATHCNTVKHTATHYNTLQHTATYPATHCNTPCRISWVMGREI